MAQPTQTTAQRVAIRIDVGPEAPLDLIAQLVQSTSTVCNVALALDRQSELNRATRVLPIDEASRIELIEYLQTRRYRPYEPPGEKFLRRLGRIPAIEQLILSSFTFGSWPPAEAQAAYLLEALPDTGPLVPTVERITYSNPLEILLTGFTWGNLAVSGVTGGSLFALLNFIAYAGPKRQKMKAEAQAKRAEADKTEAEADEKRARAGQIRTEAECKAEVTRALLQRVQDGNAILTPQQIGEIVDDRAAGAILELTQRPVEFEGRPDDEAG
ncbi:hypothetical protein [Mycobacterium intracellulare]|uniref:hypothetical protein n=1 Tax=Mycobacterium intracellulare TaxID=1767 RepID=UPI00109EDA50|nr:hypothetical protein [Mycobacterium intracellulare]